MTSLPLRTKLLLGVSLLVVASGLIISLLVTRQYSRSLYETADASARTLAHKLSLDITDSILVNDLVQIQKVFNDQLRSNSAVEYLFVLGTDKTILGSTFLQGVPSDLLLVNSTPVPPEGLLTWLRSDQGKHLIDVAWPIFEGKAGSLRLGLSLEPYRHKVTALWLEMSGLTIAVLLLSLAGGFLLIRRVTTPLALLSRAAEKFDAGNMDTRVEVKGFLEAETLGHSFNSMLERIQEHTRRLERQREELGKAHARAQTCLSLSQEMGALSSMEDLGSHLIDRLSRIVVCSRFALFVSCSGGDGIFETTRNRTRMLRGSEADSVLSLLEALQERTFLGKSRAQALPLPDLGEWTRIACFPLRHGGRTIGVLIAACPDSCFCDQRSVEIIEMVISQAVGSVRRSITFEEEFRSRSQTAQDPFLAGIVGRDPKMRLIFDLIQDIAPTDATVLIQGESGTGKELVARAVHDLSHRKDRPFVVINCSAYPETLLESELFGHERGAFTGAVRQKPGRFEQADGGTVFLDEIGEISPSAQIKLLRVLQTREFERLGGEKRVKVDVRILAATNRDLLREVEAGNFREDLFYRLNVIPLHMPPLRDRRNDIPILARHFLKKFAMEQNRQIDDFTPDAMRILLDYPWPGNVRELENTVEHAAVLAKSTTVQVDDMPGNLSPGAHPDKPQAQTIQAAEQLLLTETLALCQGNKADAARRLGISRSTLYAKLKRFNLN
jgi:transcriptional regulator with GAF, ATPase, and Fis domain